MKSIEGRNYISVCGFHSNLIIIVTEILTFLEIKAETYLPLRKLATFVRVNYNGEMGENNLKFTLIFCFLFANCRAVGD